MRRNVLIFVNSLYLILAAAAIGVPLGIGAVMAPIVFHTTGVDRPLAGSIMARAFDGAGMVTNVTLSIMLLIAFFEISYRKRANARRLLVGRWIVNLAALLVSVYMSRQLAPLLKDPRQLSDRVAFQALHGTYTQLYWVAIILIAVMIVLTQAINIGPRRDGGHPRNV